MRETRYGNTVRSATAHPHETDGALQQQVALLLLVLAVWMDIGALMPLLTTILVRMRYPCVTDRLRLTISHGDLTMH